MGFSLFGGGDAPDTPDYAAQAREEARNNRYLTQNQTVANRPTVVTPWGTSSWSQQSRFDQNAFDQAYKDWQATDTDGKGAPTRSNYTYTDWTQNVSLDPAMQRSLDAYQSQMGGRADLANGMMGQLRNTLSQPMNWGGLPARAGNVSGPTGMQTQIANPTFGFGSTPTSRNLQNDVSGGNSAAYRDRAQQAIEQLQAPQIERRRAALDSQLANQGITRGSEAYMDAMREMGDFETRAGLQAIEAGRAESDSMFNQDLSRANLNNSALLGEYGMDMQGATFNNARRAQQFGENQARGQFTNNAILQRLQGGIQAGTFNNQNRQGAIQEAQLRRMMPLNEMNALMSGFDFGSSNIPNTSMSGAGVSQGPNLSAAAQNQYAADVGQYNADQAQQQQMLNSMFQMGGMMMFSDERLKEDIRTEGHLPSGLRIVSYRYRGLPLRHSGVLAQEALKVCPDAVQQHPSGYLMVNYAELH